VEQRSTAESEYREPGDESNPRDSQSFPPDRDVRGNIRPQRSYSGRVRISAKRFRAGLSFGRNLQTVRVSQAPSIDAVTQFPILQVHQHNRRWPKTALAPSSSWATVSPTIRR